MNITTHVAKSTKGDNANVLNKIKLTLLSLIGVLILLYMSSPWWLVLVAREVMPNSLSNLSADLDYPQLSQIEISKVQVSMPSAAVDFKLEGLVSDYALKNITIASVTITKLAWSENQLEFNVDQESQNNELASLLDVLDQIFESNSIMQSVEQLTIGQLKYVDPSASKNSLSQLQVSQLQLNQTQDLIKLASGQLDFKNSFIDAPFFEQITKPSQLTLAIDRASQNLQIDWYAETSTLISVNYQREQNDKVAQIELDSEFVNSLLSSQYAGGIRVENKQIETILSSQHASQTIMLQSNNQFKLQRDILNQLLAESFSQSKELEVAQDLHFSASLLLTTGQQKSCLKAQPCQLEVALKFNNPLIMNSDSSQLMLDNFQALWRADILSNDFWPDNESIAATDFNQVELSVENNTFEWSVEQLDISHQRESMRFNELKGTSEINFPTSSLSDLLGSDWTAENRLSARVVSATIQSDLNSPEAESTSKESEAQTTTIHLKNGLLAEFSLTNLQQLISTGRLIAEPVIIDANFVNADAALSLNWQSLNMNQGIAKANLTASSVSLSDVSFDSLAIEADLKAAEKTMNGKISVAINDVPVSPISYNYLKQNQQTKLVFEEQAIDLEIINHLLNTIGKKYKIPLQIASGTLNHSGDMLLTKSALLSSYFKADQVTLLFGKNKVIGLKLDQLTTSIDPKQFESNISIESINFSSGLEISNILANVKGRQQAFQDVVEFSNVSAELFSGILSTQRLSFKETSLQPSKVSIDSLDLAALIQFLDIPGLEAQGKLQFEIPLSSINEQLVVKNGRFQSEGQGIIRYRANDQSDQAEQNIVFQALQDFHYQSFDGDISYDENGDYKIKLHLLGSNPSFYDGYPIDFTLNLNGQLSGVFRSLFLSGNFEQAVLDQVEAERKNLKKRDVKTRGGAG